MGKDTATTTIPIVFGINEDPVRLCLVTRLARPGGNATGINFLTTEVAAKRLNLLRELVPAAAHVSVLVIRNATRTESTLNDVSTAARAIGLQTQILNDGADSEINAAFAALMKSDGLLLAGDAFFSHRRVQLVHLATRHSISAIYSQREFAEIGGLMSYGPNLADTFRQVRCMCGKARPV